MKKKALISVCCSLGAAILVIVIVFAGFFIAEANLRDNFVYAEGEMVENGNRIHFLNTGGSDAILLESGGKFALIDCGEDSDNPRGFEDLEFVGYEDRVIEYVKSVAGDEDGKVYLEFVLGTHAHSDHIGGFDTLILDEDITVGKAYLKEYDESKIMAKEVNKWDNKEVYEQMVNACETRGVEIVSDLPTEEFYLGEMKIRFFNTEPVDKTNIGENENSVGTLIEVDGQKAFLAGDINNMVGTESDIKDEIGEVDLLKMGHHGYILSSTPAFIGALSPKLAIVTNEVSTANWRPRMTVTAVGCPILGTVNDNGLIVQFSGGEMQVYRDIHKD